MEAPTTPPVAGPQVSPMRMLRWEPLGATKLPGKKDGDAKKRYAWLIHAAAQKSLV